MGEKLEHKTSEFKKLENRLRRYHKRLRIESLKIAKNFEFSVGIVTTPVHLVYDIKILRNGDNVDETELFELARPEYNSLHRRYNEGLEKLEQLRTELEEVYRTI